MKVLRGIVLIVALLLALVYRLRRQFLALALRLPPVHYKVRMEEALRIPMPDGLTLAADHYYPTIPGNFPTVLIRSPYGRGKKAGAFGLLLTFSAHRFAERGYHVLVQDTRGRFDSDGDFDPYFNERADGLATLDWLKTQPWFNGVVGLWGGSYLGIVQWVIADAPEVRAMVPAITGSQLQMVVYPDGAVDLSLAMRWMAYFQALDNGKNLLHGMRLLSQVERTIAPAFTALPIVEGDALALGEPVEFYRKWLEHASPDDALWLDVHQTTHPERVTAPVHFIGGWYDFFLRALLEDYRVLRAAGRTPYLTIGPWHHFSEIISLQELREGIPWFDAHLKGDARRLRPNPVRIYVMGANEWRDLDDWPLPAQPTLYYLHARQRLDVLPPKAAEGVDNYIYNPANPTQALGGTQFSPFAGPRDNRRLEARPDVLTYTSPPLVEPLEIIGAVQMQLYAKSSLDHTDFFARLCDVYPDGRSINVCDGLFRVEPGKGAPQPDGSLCIEIDMWATAYHFRPGHRLRVQVSSGAHPRWNRNLGTGEDFISGATLKTAIQTIYHDADHPSALVMPVV
ncbi:MAG: CocE/NonD family hydrolase [Chloroflexi bacterium]|nr:CocE/NonD family hydrolase [Chloroflexota bacterium]